LTVAVGFGAIVAAVLMHAMLPPSVLALVGAAINMLLAIVFARTLGAGRDPLISVFARAERGTLEPELARYTRTLTKVWVAFFFAMAAISVWIALHPQIAARWLAAANAVAIVVLFVGEWVFRRIRFRRYRHASPFALARIVVAHWRQAGGR
jgi:uncharacterized membrane protein